MILMIMKWERDIIYHLLLSSTIMEILLEIMDNLQYIIHHVLFFDLKMN